MDGGEMTDKPIVGVDVAKDWLDLCTGEARIERIANREEAIAAWLDRVRPALVAFEPTGGYERRLVAALRQRAIVFVRVGSSPFARAVGSRPRPTRSTLA